MPKGKFIAFTDRQKQMIIDNYLTVPVKQIAEKTNCSFGRIMRFLKNNNLELPPHIVEQRKLDSRLKKGNSSWNKGKKQEDYMTAESIENSRKTRFKKGNEPHNTNKIGNGAIVSRRDSSTGRIYKYVRIKKGVWELYHRVVWEKTHGKIPENHVIVFKDENSENTDIKNLELITMTENMLRNSIHNYPKEVIPSIILSNKLERKLKNLQNG